MDNYRPISILCAGSKIIEKHVHKHFYNFLTQYDLISPTQSGFRKKHSCETALTYLINDWINIIDNGHLIGSVTVDMRKAFDVINFDILLEKLKIYGCHVSSLKWFESYIKGRKQFVINKNSSSDMNITTYGMPQGSILGPLLFLIYINDLSLHIPDTKVYVCR